MKFILLIISFFSVFLLRDQNKNYRIVITPDDSVYKWKAETSSGIREFSVPKATVIYFNNNDRLMQSVQSVCGRGNCGDGISTNFFSNGVMESLGHYSYTTNIDSLKENNSDGFLDYVDKDGDWFYWNEKGFLIKKEKWLKGHLLQTFHYQTSVL